MATRIRLRRVGRKKQASFRIVVAGSIHSNSGRVTETIGKYNPRTSPSYIEVDEARALHWLREGAVMSESVRPLFRKVGILEKYAKGVEGEGVALQGEAQGKTILATTRAAPPDEKGAKPAKAEAKEGKPEHKAEKPEAKPEPKAEAKPEPKAEAKPEPKAEAKPEPKAEAEAEDTTESAAGNEEEKSES